VTATCPECGAAGLPLLFGLPTLEAFEEAERGRLVLGGCVVPAERPRWQCPEGHRWRGTDAPVAGSERP